MELYASWVEHRKVIIFSEMIAGKTTDKVAQLELIVLKGQKPNL